MYSPRDETTQVQLQSSPRDREDSQSKQIRGTLKSSRVVSERVVSKKIDTSRPKRIVSERVVSKTSGPQRIVTPEHSTKEYG